MTVGCGKSPGHGYTACHRGERKGGREGDGSGFAASARRWAVPCPPRRRAALEWVDGEAGEAGALKVAYESGAR